MKLRKVVAAYFSDLALDIESGKVSDDCVKGLLHAIMQIEEHKGEVKEDSSDKSITEKAADEIKKDREDMSPEECLACELANMLGIGGDLTQPGEFSMAHKPIVKIKIKKVSSKDDLNKVLKGLRDGGNIDLNTMNDSLGDIFDLNSILEIMDTPMFKKGGSMNGSPSSLKEELPKQKEPDDITKMKLKYGIQDEDILRGKKSFTVKGEEYRFVNGRPMPVEARLRASKKEEGGVLETTLEEFLNN